MDISKHAEKRAKSRLGWNRKAVKNMAQKAWNDGISHNQTKGKIKRYIDSLHLKYIERNKYQCTVRVHGEVIYFFNNDVLVTLYRMDNKLIKHLKYQ